jgi:alginate O-acetyltransferase complex protein AlgJ
MQKNTDKVLLILMFVVVIYCPFFLGMMQNDKVASVVEKRALAKHPAFPTSIAAINEYPEAFNTYYSDHFGYREEMTKMYFKIANMLGGPSSFDDVTVGKDGWLFFGSIKADRQRNNGPFGDAMNLNLYTQAELEAFASTLVALKGWLKERGVEYIYTIAPNKHSIYFEKMPDFITKINKESATDQLINYLKSKTDVTVVDLRPVLLKEKQRHQVYFKYDSHWNHYGANSVQFEILKAVKSLFPDKINPAKLNEDQFEVLEVDGGDLVGFVNLDGVREERPVPVFKEDCEPKREKRENSSETNFTMICQANPLNGVIFRDSFFTSVEPYLSRSFHRSTYLWERMNYDTLKKYVEQEKPDVVIDEVVERLLPYNLPADLIQKLNDR